VGRSYRKSDKDFKQGAVQLVIETGKPIAQVARDLVINEGTLGNWCARERRARKKDRSLDPDGRAELERLRREEIELRMQRDVLIGLVGRRARLGEGRLVMC
jgi:transposase